MSSPGGPSPGKTAEMKQALYKRIVERLGQSPKVRPEDVLICGFEAPTENWSFGHDLTQFYEPE